VVTLILIICQKVENDGNKENGFKIDLRVYPPFIGDVFMLERRYVNIEV